MLVHWLHRSSHIRRPPTSLLILGVLFFGLAGCDSNGPLFDPDRPDDYDDALDARDRFDDPSLPRLKTFAPFYFEVGRYRFRVQDDGRIEYGEWNAYSSQPDSAVQTIFSAGLWMGGVQEGRMRFNTVWVSGPRSNYRPIPLDESGQSIYHIRASDDFNPPFYWPSSLGAPVSEERKPALLGEAMVWLPMITDSDPVHDLYAHGFDSILVSQTVFGYDDYRLSDVFFIRYDLENQSSADISGLHLGYHSDTDLQKRRPLGCSGLYYDNRTGFDLDRRISYTYLLSDSTRQVKTECTRMVTGYTLLETVVEGNEKVEIGSHRIYRRDTSGLGRDGFSEYNFERVEHLLLALEGLSTTGAPMINPVTGEETKWAFTGDPVAGTGWLDVPTDVRSLLSTEAFSLRSGESVSMTVAWITKREEDLDASLESMKRLADILKSYPDIWRETTPLNIRL